MLKRRSTLPLLLLLGSLLGPLSGCLHPQPDPAPTPYPPEYFSTVVALTGRAILSTTQAGTPSPTHAETTTPTEPQIPPTLVPTDTATPAPAPPIAQIQIQSPGPMSKITSPLQLRMQIVVGDSQLVQIDLQGEDGRLLARKLERVPIWPRGYYLSLKIPFAIRAAAEVGRLTISTTDKQGRIQALLGTHVLLLSVGVDEITPPGDLSERAVFYTPARSKALASGGMLDIEGRFLPFNDQPVVLELLDPAGKPINNRILDFHGTDEQTFHTSLPYKVSEATLAQLTLRQADEGFEGLIYLYSQSITLDP